MIHSRPIKLAALPAPVLPLREQLLIRRARVVCIEAEPKRVAEMVQAEMLRAARVRSIEKRAMMNAFRHRTLAQNPGALQVYRHEFGQTMNGKGRAILDCGFWILD
jgi:hypothetical protein